jgi:hypothetical protein
MALRNPKHERFARLVSDGTDPEKAYELTGFTPGLRNHNRLLREPKIHARIEELRCEREAAARAASVPIDQVLTTLTRHCVDRVEDFFDRNAGGVPTARADLQTVPVEVSIALLRFLREALGIKSGSP